MMTWKNILICIGANLVNYELAGWAEPLPHNGAHALVLSAGAIVMFLTGGYIVSRTEKS